MCVRNFEKTFPGRSPPTEIKAGSDMFTADTQSYPQALRAYLQYSLLIAANFIVYFN